jgi:probable HAF family extracellular repeat protein
MGFWGKSAAALVAAWAGFGAASAEARYQVVDLGVGLFSVVDRQTPAVAGNGWIAGADTFPALRGYVWKDGSATLVEPPQGNFSIAYDINASGTSVGITPGPGLNGPFGRPFVRTADGVLSLVPDLFFAPSVNVRAAYGINDAGVVVGEWERIPFIYTNGASAALARPVDPVSNFEGAAGAYDINNNGWAVGYASYPFGNAGAILWRDGKAIDLGSLPLDAGFNRAAAANAINDANVIVGRSLTSLPGGTGSRASHAFRWADGAWLDLGTLVGPARNSAAHAINGQGLIVGQSDCLAVACAFLWSQAEGMLDLNALIDPAADWKLSIATGINDDGWIVGQGFQGGVARDFLLLPTQQPIPEPATALMLALGLVMLLLHRMAARRS